jgi:membrane dipeptidase
VIMINFGSTFLDGEVARQSDGLREQLMTRLDSLGLAWRDAAAKPVIEAFRRENPRLYSDVERVANHIDHVRRVAGIDYIGLGSDYDGVGDSLPVGLKDVSQYPNLIYELLKRGYSRRDIAKICYRNLWRVWKAVEREAATQA